MIGASRSTTDTGRRVTCPTRGDGCASTIQGERQQQEPGVEGREDPRRPEPRDRRPARVVSAAPRRDADPAQGARSRTRSARGSWRRPRRAAPRAARPPQRGRRPNAERCMPRARPRLPSPPRSARRERAARRPGRLHSATREPAGRAARPRERCSRRRPRRLRPAVLRTPRRLRPATAPRASTRSGSASASALTTAPAVSATSVCTRTSVMGSPAGESSGRRSRNGAARSRRSRTPARARLRPRARGPARCSGGTRAPVSPRARRSPRHSIARQRGRRPPLRCPPRRPRTRSARSRPAAADVIPCNDDRALLRRVEPHTRRLRPRTLSSVGPTHSHSSGPQKPAPESITAALSHTPVVLADVDTGVAERVSQPRTLTSLRRGPAHPAPTSCTSPCDALRRLRRRARLCVRVSRLASSRSHGGRTLASTTSTTPSPAIRASEMLASSACSGVLTSPNVESPLNASAATNPTSVRVSRREGVARSAAGSVVNKVGGGGGRCEPGSVTRRFGQSDAGRGALAIHASICSAPHPASRSAAACGRPASVPRVRCRWRRGSWGDDHRRGPTGTTAPRPRNTGSSSASLKLTTGSTQASSAAKRSSHSALVRDRSPRRARLARARRPSTNLRRHTPRRPRAHTCAQNRGPRAPTARCAPSAVS